ncbi:MAG: ABC transporter ATP-binding protein/permease [Eubacterium sp.]|nr:ABC transporter ATP-binding protein/permease [Eubacterium sp.]
MRWIEAHEEKAPLVKNVIYAIKTIWGADKWYMLSAIAMMTIDMVFNYFIQNILFLKILLSVIEGERDFKVYVRYLLAFVAVAVVSKALSWYFSYVNDVGAKRFLKSMNRKIFDKAGRLDISCYENPEFYDIYQRAAEVMTRSYYHGFNEGFALIIGNLISFAFVAATVASIDRHYLLFLVPILFVFVIEVFKSRYSYKRDLRMTTNNRVKAYIQRTVFLRDYSKDMRTSNIFLVLMRRFEGAIKANLFILKKYGMGLFLYSLVSSLFSEFIPIIGTYAFAGYQFVNTDKMTVSGFSVVLSSINSVRGAVDDIANSFSRISEMSLYFDNLHKFFDYEPAVTDGKLEAGEFESLEFRNVTFKYPSAKRNALENVSFKINKGESIAVVGVNGAGKTTLVKLLLRFYDPVEGEILYNGVNIKEYNLHSLRSSFGAVFQDYRNFAVSVYENVMCKECDTDEKLFARDALIKSGVWKKIEGMKNGGDTVLTKEFDKEGVGLSGGENQKLSTARLFAGDFDIAVLDEPSSALDPIAEYSMYENLIEATEGKTVIYISHRLASAVLSDRIIVLDSGRVSEEGTHAELMKSGGEYSKMFALQASSYNSGEVSENE